MHYSLWIGLRHLHTKRRSGFVSRVTLVAVGGTFVGSPNDETSFPQTMLVDYVKVYQ
jgi:hypothetical protein